MVYAKVTDGKEMRKFRVDPDTNFDSLKKQITKLFPSLQAEGVEFNVQYRDADGDVISISTDEEVQTALSHLPADETWLIQAVRVPTQRVRPRASNRYDASGSRTTVDRREIVPFGGSLLGRILDDVNPFWTPGTSLMDWSNPAFERWEDDVEEEWKHRKEQLHKMHNDHMKIYEEQMKKAEADVKKALKERRSSKGGEVAKSGEPKWNVQTFGSWEPQVMESPHGSRTVIGPVGYHMYWGYSDPEEPKSQGEQPAQQQGEQKREETSSATPQQGEHKEAGLPEQAELKKTPQQGEHKKEDAKSSTHSHRQHKKV